MTINELLAELDLIPKNYFIEFSFCACRPTTISSWRGIYALPALNWATVAESKSVTVGSLIEELTNAISGKVFEGYKGGEYTYDGNEELHIDKPGACSYTNIAKVVLKDGYVVIYTGVDE